MLKHRRAVSIPPASVSTCIINVRVNVNILQFQNSLYFFIEVNPLTTKAHGSRAIGDCGTSGCQLDSNQGPLVHAVRL